MNKKIVMWAAVIALVSGPALNVLAQEGPGPGDDDEIEMNEGGPGGGGPGMQPGMGQGRGQMGPGMKGEGGMGQEKMMIKKKMMMREGRGGGGPGFMQEDEILAMITKYDPAFAKKIGDLKEIAPGKYKMIMQMSGKMFGMARMQQNENIEKDAVRALSLEYETKELGLKFEKSTDADKKTIKETLRGKLAELFDLKTKAQELRVKRMDAEIASLKKNLESRKVNKAKIVEQRLEQMTGEGYGW
ncbi:MAG: hypothetical protein PHV36_09080 [Elusimicrobiales bacterium]|nr:hypothetical protein [Elusimicrobiales bacterium]